MNRLLYLFVLYCIIFTFTSATTMDVISSVSVDNLQRLPSKENVIRRHLAIILNKRASRTVPNNPQLFSCIIAEIKARIQTDITSKISASIFQKVKANLSIKASVFGGVIKIEDAEVEAIQTAVVDGLQTKITQTVDEKFEKVISDSISPQIDTMLPSQKVLTTNQLTNVLMKAETIVRSEINVTLPEIEKTLKSSVNTQLKAHIKDVEVDIPGVLKIQISAKINIVSSVKTVVTSIYKSYANVSVAVTVKSYIKGIQQAMKKV